MSMREILTKQYNSLVFAEGFDDAIVGVVHRCAFEPVVCYDQERCIEILMESGAGSYSEAADYFDHNVAGAYVGPSTPMFLVQPFDAGQAIQKNSTIKTVDRSDAEE